VLGFERKSSLLIGSAGCTRDGIAASPRSWRRQRDRLSELVSREGQECAGLVWPCHASRRRPDIRSCRDVAPAPERISSIGPAERSAMTRVGRPPAAPTDACLRYKNIRRPSSAPPPYGFFGHPCKQLASTRWWCIVTVPVPPNPLARFTGKSRPRRYPIRSWAGHSVGLDALGSIISASKSAVALAALGTLGVGSSSAAAR
jgi:hypothetical protein